MPPLSLAWFIWSLGALFYLVGFFQRVAPAVMTDELMQDFSINAAALGNLSALYFYSYVFMQIPTGILADRLGPRRLLSIGALTAGAGTVLFALAQDFFWAGLGRFLIGGSVAVAFVGLMKLTTNWFQHRWFAMVTGVALLAGVVGAVFGGPPLRLLINSFSWRPVLLGSALGTFALAVLIWVFVRDHPRDKGYAPVTGLTGGGRVQEQHIVRGLITVVKNRNVLLLFLIPGGLVGCVLTFAGLWGVPFLRTHHDLSTARASFLTSAMMVAWALGGPFFGWLSDRIGRRKPLFLLGCSCALGGWLVIVFLPDIPMALLFLALVLSGFCTGSMIVAFAFGKESVAPPLAGTVSGVINMGIMLGPTIMQPLVGWVLDTQWQGQTVNSIRVYSFQAYQAGFCCMLGWLALAIVLLALTRETFCRQLL
jgi:MFS family permease